MKYEPIVNNFFKRFLHSFELQDTSDENSLFERFVNYVILSSHQPDIFACDTNLLDKICTGGRDDMGIDGMVVKLNNLLVGELEEAKNILEKHRKVKIEFIFIQSKKSPSFDSGEFLKFCSGVSDFLSGNQQMPCNKKILNFLEIKNYLLSDDNIHTWSASPIVRMYYVAMGTWEDPKHFKAHVKWIKESINNHKTYSEPNVHFLDVENLKNICETNSRTFSKSIETIESMPLPSVEGVDNSCVILCSAKQYVELLVTEDGLINKSLFDDNVRDYQGISNVNDEITKTIESEPEKFSLLNNGITIVCDEYTQKNRSISLQSPQVVNGCQTSHILFNYKERIELLDKIILQIKVISTKNSEITNQVVRGTNRQNIVYDEAFETTRKFHKDLEQFFLALNAESSCENIFYERRSKQFNHDPKIKQTDKVNLRVLIQYSVGLLFNQPHLSHKHEIKLLSDFSGKIFLDTHSRLPYYVISLLFIRAEKIFKKDSANYKTIQPFRAHILMVLKEISCGSMPPLSNEKETKKYFTKLQEIVSNDESLAFYIQKSINILKSSNDHWVNVLHKSLDGRKDIPEFSNCILSQCESPPKDDANTLNVYCGKVKRVICDRNRLLCGFIENELNDDVFFHSKANPLLNFHELEGCLVSYKLVRDEKSGKLTGQEVKRN